MLVHEMSYFSSMNTEGIRTPNAICISLQRLSQLPQNRSREESNKHDYEEVPSGAVEMEMGQQP